MSTVMEPLDVGGTGPYRTNDPNSFPLGKYAIAPLNTPAWLRTFPTEPVSVPGWRVENDERLIDRLVNLGFYEEDLEALTVPWRGVQYVEIYAPYTDVTYEHWYKKSRRKDAKRHKKEITIWKDLIDYEDDMVRLVAGWALRHQVGYTTGYTGLRFRKKRGAKVNRRRSWNRRRPTYENIHPDHPEYVKRLYGDYRTALQNHVQIRHNGSPVWWTDLDRGPVQAVTLRDLVTKTQPMKARNGRELWMMSLDQFDNADFPPESQGGPPYTEHVSVGRENPVATRTISDEQIAFMYGEGMSIRDIASAYGMGKDTVEKALKRTGTPTRTHKEAALLPSALVKAGRTDPRTEQRIVEMYLSGQSVEAVAQSIGVGWSTVKNVLTRHDIDLRPFVVPMKPPPDVEQRAVEMYRDGKSLSAIGRELGISHTGVRNILLRHGIERRPRGDVRRFAGENPENPVTEDLYPLAGKAVSGLRVRSHVPNVSSIGASLTDWEELSGIREVSFNLFDQMGPLHFYSSTEQERIEALAREIQASREIDPLIVVIDEQGPYVLEGAHRFDALRILGIPSFPAKVVIDQDAGGQVRENPIAQEGGAGLICMGRKVEIDLRKPAIGSGSNSKSIVPPRDAGMLYDGSGTYWPKCSLLISEFDRGETESDEGSDYFGRDATVFEGNVDLPPMDLAAWHQLGEVDQVFYDRAGTKYPGFFRHKFNKPRGLWKLIWPFKRGAKSPAILYSLWQRKTERQFYRIELPAGCIVDDRGIAVP